MKHNRASYVGGCRCEVCTEANRAYREQQRRRNGVPPREEAQHGSPGMYECHGCRCDACVEGNRARSRDYYHRTHPGARRYGWPAPHGTTTTYGRGCRCEDCRSAKRAYDREWRRVRAATTGRTVGA